MGLNQVTYRNGIRVRSTPIIRSEHGYGWTPSPTASTREKQLWAAAIGEYANYYRLTPSDRWLLRRALWYSQAKRCYWCCKRIPFAGAAVVDHNHATGQIRGLAHDECNRYAIALADAIRTAKAQP